MHADLEIMSCCKPETHSNNMVGLVVAQLRRSPPIVRRHTSYRNTFAFALCIFLWLHSAEQVSGGARTQVLADGSKQCFTVTPEGHGVWGKCDQNLRQHIQTDVKVAPRRTKPSLSVLTVTPTELVNVVQDGRWAIMLHSSDTDGGDFEEQLTMATSVPYADRSRIRFARVAVDARDGEFLETLSLTHDMLPRLVLLDLTDGHAYSDQDYGTVTEDMVEVDGDGAPVAGATASRTLLNADSGDASVKSEKVNSIPPKPTAAEAAIAADNVPLFQFGGKLFRDGPNNGLVEVVIDKNDPRGWRDADTEPASGGGGEAATTATSTSKEAPPPEEEPIILKHSEIVGAGAEKSENKADERGDDDDESPGLRAAPMGVAGVGGDVSGGNTGTVVGALRGRVKSILSPLDATIKGNRWAIAELLVSGDVGDAIVPTLSEREQVSAFMASKIGVQKLLMLDDSGANRDAFRVACLLENHDVERRAFAYLNGTLAQQTAQRANVQWPAILLWEYPYHTAPVATSEAPFSVDKITQFLPKAAMTIDEH